MKIRVLANYGKWVKGEVRSVTPYRNDASGLYITSDGLIFKSDASTKKIIRWICK